MMESLERLFCRLNLMVSLGRIKTGNDTGNVQLLQVQLGQDEIHDNLPRLGEYGHASLPPKDADVLILFIGGNRDNGVVIATGHIASRLKNLQPGESAIYDDLGQKVHLTRNGIVVSGAGLPMNVQNITDLNVNATGKVTLNASEVDFLGAGGTAKGCVQGDCVCPYTGAPHVMVSATVKATK